MKITLLDGSVKEFDKALTVKEIAENIAVSLKKATVGAVIDGNQKVASDYLVDKDCTLELVTNKQEGMYDEFISSTAAAISAYATDQVFKDAQIAEVFYNADEYEFAFTFHRDERLKLEQVSKIQDEVNKLLTTDIKIENKKVTETNDLGLNTYQLHTADEEIYKKGYAIVTTINDTYKIVSSEPICVEDKLLKEIHLQQLTGSYWLDDSKNVMLQRIHGLAATSKKELDKKEEILKDRRSRDHREINKTLEIFDFDPLIGQGLPIWLPNGTILKDTIKDYLKEKEWEYDYVQVQTPVIGTLDLYRTSGHLDHYRDDMFQPFKAGNEEFVLKPMSCPHHIAIYRSKPRSYRDLPLRYAEHALQHRYESSGSLTGLERVRAMELTDSHIFVRPDQVEEEFKSIYKLIEEVLATFHIDIDYLSFSVRDPEDKEKYYQNDEMWDRAEAELEGVLKDLNLPYKKMVGEAAFYGPKLDIQAKTAQNHEITISTIQLDFLLPEKFDLTYVDEKGQLTRPIMIHRGLIGTYERFVATLLEQTKGVLPVWLAPNQIEIIPVGGTDAEKYAEQIRQEFKKRHLRSHIDLRDERLSYKIRDAQVHKIPYQLVLGKNEIDNNTLTYRKYGSEEQTTIPANEFYDLVSKQVAEKQ
ncbi:threonine--tRNA ligase [Mesoplasma lactucae]|uniref:Threonine--tRNA ligase n=1 Tax=Mesoplasma lactucae ATCC 49193 TaxID=81460 RepID=A0A291IRB5_9MOLU|nr:threonine--tRNA ligase [Mesoplasma lactucae]ATG97231.1 threonine--tRNA ligase [Mesoplasma lactucae ATCC 49193]ATZ20326.1 threonyl-tRNA synthetase [Mesoplasma lactucae ATCC 49193]MCL8216497.1 Threonine--tRNA ligase [Mesoplasma lactucae ATCC 49193]